MLNRTICRPIAWTIGRSIPSWWGSSGGGPADGDNWVWEDGQNAVAEDGQNKVWEDDDVAAVTTVVNWEDGEDILWEDGEDITLE